MKSKHSALQGEHVSEAVDGVAHHTKLKAHKLGDISLTITTLILVVVSICYDTQFAPFIILLMSSRIGASIYTVIKTASKMEIRKLILWLALFGKSAFSYCQFLGVLA